MDAVPEAALTKRYFGQAIAEIQNRDELNQQLSRRHEEGERRNVAAVRNVNRQYS